MFRLQQSKDFFAFAVFFLWRTQHFISNFQRLYMHLCSNEAGESSSLISYRIYTIRRASVRLVLSRWLDVAFTCLRVRLHGEDYESVGVASGLCVCMWVRMRRIYTKCAAYLFFFHHDTANLGQELERMLLWSLETEGPREWHLGFTKI